ncbi:MAG: hypothetical protein NVS2B7_40400 [Herpetosiphon sp.]
MRKGTIALVLLGLAIAALARRDARAKDTTDAEKATHSNDKTSLPGRGQGSEIDPGIAIRVPFDGDPGMAVHVPFSGDPGIVHQSRRGSEPLTEV